MDKLVDDVPMRATESQQHQMADGQDTLGKERHWAPREYETAWKEPTREKAGIDVVMQGGGDRKAETCPTGGMKEVTHKRSPTEVSWQRDLRYYLKNTVEANRGADEAETIAKLIDCVVHAHDDAETWWKLLYSEECAMASAYGVMPKLGDLLKRTSSQSVLLCDLYDWATRLVPQKGNKKKSAFVNIWLGHARQQWLRGKDDALDAIKALKTQQIGLEYAPMYIEWSSIESVNGNERKALSIIQKGINEGAQPAEHLQTIKESLISGKFVYKPFWEFSINELELQAFMPSESERQHTTAHTPIHTAVISTHRNTGVVGSTVQDAHRLASLSRECIGSVGHTYGMPSGKTVDLVARSLGFRESHPTPTLHIRRATSVHSASQSRSGSSKGPSDDDATVCHDSHSTPGIGHHSISYPKSGYKTLTHGEKTICSMATSSSVEKKAFDSHPEIQAAAKASHANENKQRMTTPAEKHGVSMMDQGDGSIKKHDNSSMRDIGNLNTGKEPRNWHTEEHAVGCTSRGLRAIPENGSHHTVAHETEKGSKNLESVPSILERRETPSVMVDSAGKPQRNALGNLMPVQRSVSFPSMRAPGETTPAAKKSSEGASADVRTMAPPPPIAPSGRQEGQASTSTRRIVEDEGMVMVRGIRYTKLECVGKGGSSKVYKVMAPNKKIFALKRIRLNGRDSEAASGFLDEITLLTRLKGKSNIIQLIDSEVHQKDGIIYMVLECGDIDLARLLQRHEASKQERRAALSDSKPRDSSAEVDENFVRLYWEQMLLAVDTIHKERIVHSDLKPANFLVVEGQLKLIDFGIAKAIQADTTSIARESQVGTLNYMSPEAITGGDPRGGGPPTKVGRPSDIWSLGCILYQMVYGKTPFAHLPFIQKMHAIIDEKHDIRFPPLANPYLLDVIQKCLVRHPKSRITMQELLDHPFLHPSHTNETSLKEAVSDHVELSKDQLRELLQQIAASGVNCSEVNSLSDKLFMQLANSRKETPPLNPQKQMHSSSIGQPRKPLQTIQQQEQQQL